MTAAELRELHIKVWGVCPYCKTGDPIIPHGKACENCDNDRARLYHGRSQAVRLERRPRTDDK